MSVVLGNLSPTEAPFHHGSVMSEQLLEQLLGGWGGVNLSQRDKCTTTDPLVGHKFDAAAKKGKISP